MIDSMLNLLFRCSHRRITRPLTPVSAKGVAHGNTYVVCLDCGKQFDYDLTEMRIGKPIDHSHDSSVVPKDVPRTQGTKLKYALMAAVPVALVVGAIFKTNKHGSQSGAPADNTPDPDGGARRTKEH